MKTYAFGIDVGGTNIKIGLFKTDGTLVETWEIPTRIEEKGKYILEEIAGAIQSKVKEHNIENDIEGIGLAVPGPVNNDGIVLNCVNLGWGKTNAKEIMENLVHYPVTIGKDSNVAALGEMWLGGGQGYKNVVMITLGTGVGCGIVIDGKSFTGAFGAAGEFGHVNIRDDESEPCGCGKKGCFEQYASANGIVRVTKRYLASHIDDTILRSYNPLTAKDICNAAKDGDTVALMMLDLEGKMLGRALGGAACLLNPEVFIIGGGLSKAGDILLKPIEKWFMHYCNITMTNTEFKLATLGNNAGIYGAFNRLMG